MNTEAAEDELRKRNGPGHHGRNARKRAAEVNERLKVIGGRAGER